MIELVPVTRDYLERIWPKIEQQVRRAVKRSRGTFSEPRIKTAIRDGAQQLWLAAEDKNILGVMGTAISIRHDGRRVLRVEWLAGKDYARWAHLFDRVKEWARDKQQCHAIEYEGREGWRQLRPQSRVAALIYEEAL